MELQLKKEPVFLNEIIYDGQTEQGVEFDYVLPDYYPDIFKIVRCSLVPGISSYSISGTQLFIDGAVTIKILYLADDCVNIHSVEQRYTYSKTLELTKAASKAQVDIQTKTDYCNCRAVSGRRFDVRGAVSCKIRACAQKTVEVISGAEGLETKSDTLSYCGSKLIGGGQFVVREDIETGSGKGGIVGVIHHDTCAAVNDVKVIAGKAVVKGEVKVKALYIVKIDENTQDTEVMEAVIPVSRIMDIDGLDDSYICFADLRVMECGLEVKSGDMGDNRVLGCDLTLDCRITACRETSIPILTDLFSTEYETDFTKSTVKTEYSPAQIQKQLTLKTVLECKEGNISEIFDCRCELTGISCRPDGEGSLTVSGMLSAQALGRLSGSDMPVFIEKNDPVELTCECSVSSENCVIDHNIQISDVGFNINGDNTAELRVSLTLTACVYKVRSMEIIQDVILDSDRPKEKNTDYALKMYYAEENESVFSIAKKYNTVPDAIREENELETEVITEPCLLLIPLNPTV